MRNFKKVIALVIAVALMMSTFTVAFAAETTETSASKLVTLGLLSDASDASLSAGLTREIGLTMILKALGYKQADADKAAAAPFTDTKGWVTAWANLAYEKGITKGATATTFAGSAELTGNQFVTFALRAFGVEVTDTTKAAELAVTAGLLPAGSTIAADFTKANAADVMFAAMSMTVPGTTPAVKLIDKLVADKVVTEEAAVAAGLVSATLTVSAKAVGAKKLEVTFNKAVDKAKAVITVKKGTVAVNTDKVEFAADAKSAVITTTTNLTKGDYTITVSGLDKDVTATVAAEDVKVAKINVTSTTAPRLAGNDKKALVTYEVLNQYGEKMTGQSISWTISTGVVVGNENTTNGTFEITAAGGADFVPGAVVYITGVHAASATVVNAQVQIALASQPDAVTFKGVYDTQDSKLVDLPAGFVDNRYVLLLEVKDQYGNKMSNPDKTKLVFTSNNPLFVSSDTASGAFATAADVTIDGVVYEAVELNPGSAVDNGGDVTVQAISTLTGKTSTFTATAQAVAALKTFSLSAPTAIVAEGEKIEIPFTAVDQYGNAVTKFSKLNGKVTLASGLQFVQQNDGSAKLEYTAPATGASTGTDLPVYLTSLVAAGGNFSSLMIYVKETAVPTAIIGLDSDVSTSIALGNRVDVLPKNLVVQDQYGRTMSDANFEAWVNTAAANSVVVSTTVGAPITSGLNGGADAATVVLGTSTDYVRLAAIADSASNETVKFELATGNDGSSVSTQSAKTVTVTKVLKSSYTSFVVDDLGTMFNDAGAATQADTKFDKTVKVYGVLANGTKVALPAADFTVTTSGKLAISSATITDHATAGYVTADFRTASNEAKNVTTTVLVTVNDDNGAALSIIEKELVLSDAASKVATVTMKGDKVKEGKATINPAVAAIDAANFRGFIDTQKDQYGVAITENPTITITALTKVGGSTFTVTGNGTAGVAVAGATMGDKFTATYKYASGVTVVVEFTVGLPQ